MTGIYVGLYRILSGILGWIFKTIALIFDKKIYNERFKIELKMNIDFWIHVASVGEFNAVKPLLKKLTATNKKVLLTTMTKTGLVEAKKSNINMYLTLLPIDTPQNMRKFFNLINPKMIIIEETEFWPNMLYEAKKRKVKTMIVNGRISDRSYSKYKITKTFWKYFDSSYLKICTQSNLDSERFLEIGFSNVKKCNNLKFCVTIENFNKTALRDKFGFSTNEKIIVFGSSRPGEEELILKIFSKLKIGDKNLKLVIVPRHLDRLEDVKKIIPTDEFRLLSENVNDRDILVVDQMGVLIKFYAVSDISIVGGSFYDFGGHNPLEPAAYSKPIIIGEYHHSCRDSVNKLIEKEGIIISNKSTLENDLGNLLKSESKRKILGKNAFSVITNNSNSLDLHLKEIYDFKNKEIK